MWKPLISFSIILAGLAGWLRFETTTDLKHERQALIDSATNLGLAQKYQKEVQDKNEEHVTTTASTSDAADTQEAEEASKRTEKGEKENSAENKNTAIRHLWFLVLSGMGVYPAFREKPSIY